MDAKDIHTSLVEPTKNEVTNLSGCSISMEHGEKLPERIHSSRLKNRWPGTSLVAQWLRIRLPTQRTWVRALVQEDPTCHGATKPMHHDY